MLEDLLFQGSQRNTDFETSADYEVISCHKQNKTHRYKNRDNESVREIEREGRRKGEER